MNRFGSRHMSGTRLLLGGLAGAGLTALAALVALEAPWGDPAEAVARGLIVAVPVAAGLVALGRGHNERFASLLIAIGVLGAVAALGDADAAALRVVGRFAWWMLELLLVYAILAFPSGRLTSPVDRWIVAAAAIVIAALFVPRLGLSAAFETPSPATGCTEACPENPLFAFDSEPGFVDSVYRPLGSLAIAAVMAAVLIRLALHARSVSPLARRIYLPVIAVGAFRVGVLGAGFVAREVDPGARIVEVSSWTLALAIPALALAFLAGLLNWRLYAAASLERLAESLRGGRSPRALERALRAGLEDRRLRLLLPGPESGWVDTAGTAVTDPKPRADEAVSELAGPDGVVGLVVHDAALDADPRFGGAAMEMTYSALEALELGTRMHAAERDALAARARLAAASEDERRRIERDLHDGAQQRLVALRIELGLAEAQVAEDPAAAAERIHRLQGDVDEALEEIRTLAHGVYPALLERRGLEAAVKATGERAALPVAVRDGDTPRYEREVEIAAYFCISEAIQNAVKHSAGTRVSVEIDAGEDELRFTVRDDGEGLGRLAAGRGLDNMADRVAAVGGSLELESAPGRGTAVIGCVPARPLEIASLDPGPVREVRLPDGAEGAGREPLLRQEGGDLRGEGAELGAGGGVD